MNTLQLCWHIEDNTYDICPEDRALTIWCDEVGIEKCGNEFIVKGYQDNELIFYATCKEVRHI